MLKIYDLNSFEDFLDNVISKNYDMNYAAIYASHYFLKKEIL